MASDGGFATSAQGADTSLPFFAYGVFRVDEIAYPQIAQWVAHALDADVRAQPLLRDGLLLLTDGAYRCGGSLLFFRRPDAATAYQAIEDFEPFSLYRWERCTACAKDGSEHRAMVLYGLSPAAGSEAYEAYFSEWHSADDPLFVEGLAEVVAAAEEASKIEHELRALFRFQMAYLLLWTAIERYVTLRWGRYSKVSTDGTPISAYQRVMKLATEDAFAHALSKHVAPGSDRAVRRSDDPAERAQLDPADPTKALRYYYQVRSNIVHRGKASVREHRHVEDSLYELSLIFADVLDETIGPPTRGQRARWERPSLFGD